MAEGGEGEGGYGAMSKKPHLSISRLVIFFAPDGQEAFMVFPGRTLRSRRQRFTNYRCGNRRR